MQNDYWPGDAWRVSTPEEQGMDSEKLLNMLNYIESSNLGMHSIVVIRNGYMVMDAGFFPYKSDIKHAINSCTKSITSTLLGIAERENLIHGTDQKVLDYFSDRSIKNVDEKKKTLTLENLLTMTPGFEWSENGYYGSDDSWMQASWNENPVGFILDKPVPEEPGTVFYYNSGASHLLSAVLQKATGKKAYDYANEKLFTPIGIKEVYWNEDPQGINIGGGGAYMTPLDMARFGYLYLKNGYWNGTQVVPERWVQQATAKQIDTPNGLAGKYGYGYQWWMNNFGGYSARGYGGQYIFVLPEYEIVAVFTASMFGSQFFLPESLVESFIIPAVKSSKAISGSEETTEKLNEKLRLIQQPPETGETSVMPETAYKLSGREMKLENGNELSLTFNKGTNAIFAEFSHGPSNKILVGLDDVYRVSDAGIYWPLPEQNLVAAKGFWEEENEFILKLISLHEADELTYRFTFTNSDVNVEFTSRQGGEIMNSKGKIE